MNQAGMFTQEEMFYSLDMLRLVTFRDLLPHSEDPTLNQVNAPFPQVKFSWFEHCLNTQVNNIYNKGLVVFRYFKVKVLIYQGE